MSTAYRTQNKTDAASHAAALKGEGWLPCPTDEGVYTNGKDYVHVDMPEAIGYMELTRYGANEVEDLVDNLGLISEYDDEF